MDSLRNRWNDNFQLTEAVSCNCNFRCLAFKSWVELSFHTKHTLQDLQGYLDHSVSFCSKHFHMILDEVFLLRDDQDSTELNTPLRAQFWNPLLWHLQGRNFEDFTETESFAIKNRCNFRTFGDVCIHSQSWTFSLLERALWNTLFYESATFDRFVVEKETSSTQSLDRSICETAWWWFNLILWELNIPNIEQLKHFAVECKEIWSAEACGSKGIVIENYRSILNGDDYWSTDEHSDEQVYYTFVESTRDIWTEDFAKTELHLTKRSETSCDVCSNSRWTLRVQFC